MLPFQSGEQEEGVQRGCPGDSLEVLPFRAQQQLYPRHTHLDSIHQRKAKYLGWSFYQAKEFLGF